MNEDGQGGGGNRVAPECYIPPGDTLDSAVTPSSFTLLSTNPHFLSRLYTTELCLYGHQAILLAVRGCRCRSSNRKDWSPFSRVFRSKLFQASPSVYPVKNLLFQTIPDCNSTGQQ